MKKGVAIVAGVVVVGGVAWLGATWYTGKRIEAEAPARVKEVNDQMAKALPAPYKVELRQVSYERGFFSTKVRYGLVMSAPAAITGDKAFAIEPGMLEFDATVQHGPFPGGALARGHILPNAAFVHAEVAQTEALKPFFALTNGKAPLWSDTVIHYSGDSTGTGGLAPIKSTQDGLTLEFSGATMQAAYKRESQAIKGSFKSDSLVATNPKDEQVDKVAISGMSMDLDTHMGKFGMSVGNTNMQVKRVELQGKQYPMSLDDLGYKLVINEDDKLLNGEAAYSVGKFRLGTTDMGGGQAVIKLANLDGKASEKLAKTYSDLVSAMMAESTGAADPQPAAPQPAAPDPKTSEALMKRVANDVRDVLVASPTLAIDPILWKTDKGEARITYSLALQPLKDTDAPVQDLVRQAIKSMQAHAAINKPMAQDLLARTFVATAGATPEQAAAQANDQLQSALGMAMMMNVARVDGDNVVTDFVYDGAKATLNGQEIPLDALLADAVGAAGDTEPDMPDGVDPDSSPQADATMLHSLDQATIGSLIESAGFELEHRTDQHGEPELNITPGASGARELYARFNECDVDDACENVMLQAVFDSVSPPPYKIINDWNSNNRWGRMYVDGNNQPTLEMDINAYGGIGKDGVEAFVQTFLETVPEVNALLENASKAKTK
ncbi:Bacterial protein of uncharacterised function (DUF945) [Bordetella ansorpii]|uniref:Bacterial protein of uncharacterized function (DUF945) n=1 Tax=Bordetella ansorpii TaxID=288768 RepID=A0A157P085_9BORD|nr:DUF945 family protein [Bordetella ansorpii]SAI26750.1 Bacterial protein of uncharacterised function (DUF945) [Bordetella ansorpii]